ncbi:MAG: hypothetical protein ACREUR_01840 [Nitrosospira sp.]
MKTIRPLLISTLLAFSFTSSAALLAGEPNMAASGNDHPKVKTDQSNKSSRSTAMSSGQDRRFNWFHHGDESSHSAMSSGDCPLCVNTIAEGAFGTHPAAMLGGQDRRFNWFHHGNESSHSAAMSSRDHPPKSIHGKDERHTVPSKPGNIREYSKSNTPLNHFQHHLPEFIGINNIRS